MYKIIHSEPGNTILPNIPKTDLCHLSFDINETGMFSKTVECWLIISNIIFEIESKADDVLSFDIYSDCQLTMLQIARHQLLTARYFFSLDLGFSVLGPSWLGVNFSLGGELEFLFLNEIADKQV